MPVREKTIAALIDELGEDITRDGLKDTPKRVVSAWDEFTAGYSYEPAEVLRSFDEPSLSPTHSQMVFQGGIQLYSLCEHHLVPFFGVAHIGYIATRKVVGLSKLARIVEVFARRLSVQERITNEVANTLYEFIEGNEGVGVVLQCRHLCSEMRGVEKAGTITISSALRGSMYDDAATRAEFMSMVATASQGLRSL